MEDSFEPKKLAIIRIVQILEQESDDNHHLTQKEILDLLKKRYGITLERKAVGRTISMLQEVFDNYSPVDKAHLGIELDLDKRRSVYFRNRLFEDSELRLLIDSVLASKHIGVKHTKDLIEKLCLLSSKYFKSHVKHVNTVNDWNKTDNIELLLNMEKIDEAIEKGCKIQFDYYKYGTDGKLHKSSEHIASPYQLILHNQRYYLMFLSETWGNISYWRLDKMKDLKVLEDNPIVPLRSIKGYENGVDFKKISSSLPYLFSDDIEHIEFVADNGIIDQIVDWFGSGVKIARISEEKVKVSLNASPMAMEYWAMQYLNSVEVVFPKSLRETIKANLENATKKYNS